MFKYETLTFPNEMKTADKNHSHSKFSSSLSNFFKKHNERLPSNYQVYQSAWSSVVEGYSL